MTAQPTVATPTKPVHTEYLTDELARAQELLAQIDAAPDYSRDAVARRYGDVVGELRLLIAAINTDAAVRAMRDAR